MTSGALPRLGVSRCLLGDPVRYDGAAKRSDAVLALLEGRFEAVPVCPEVEAGLPVPRPPVWLVRVAGEIRALGVDDPSLDLTRLLENQARDRLERLPPLAGFILKARSPSCGLFDTPLFQAPGEPPEPGAGIFARRLRERFPELPLADEGMIADPEQRAAFLRAVASYSGS